MWPSPPMWCLYLFLTLVMASLIWAIAGILLNLRRSLLAKTTRSPRSSMGCTPYRYMWELSPEEQTLPLLVEAMEISLCKHAQPYIETKPVQAWMDLLKEKVRQQG